MFLSIKPKIETKTKTIRNFVPHPIRKLTGRVRSKQKRDDYHHGHQGENNAFNYNPHPVDMTNLTLNREMQNMAERLAENSHDIWAKKKREEIDTCGGAIHSQLVPYDLLTDKEKRKDRERSQEFLKYMQYQGLKLHK